MEKNNEKKRSLFSKIWKWIPFQIKIGIVIAIVAAAGFAVLLNRCDFGNNSVGFVTDDKIDITPTQIESIKTIGQWEFLAVTDEELVDTVRKGLISDDELVRIYYGTMRLGIDLAETKDGWIKASGDTVDVTLPPIKLLDEEFIDEAKTRPFIQRGKWSDQDRAAMYNIANRKMKAKGLSPENLEAARTNAVTQFTALMRSMGFKNVKVKIEGVKKLIKPNNNYDKKIKVKFDSCYHLHVIVDSDTYEFRYDPELNTYCSTNVTNVWGGLCNGVSNQTEKMRIFAREIGFQFDPNWQMQKIAREALAFLVERVESSRVKTNPEDIKVSNIVDKRGYNREMDIKTNLGDWHLWYQPGNANYFTSEDSRITGPGLGIYPNDTEKMKAFAREVSFEYDPKWGKNKLAKEIFKYLKGLA